MITGWEKDLTGALRLFGRAPGFAAVIVVTLAIGVGAATAVYSVLRGVVLTPLEFEESDRVVVLWGETPDYPRAPLTVGDYNALADGVGAFSEISATWGNTALLLGDAEAEQVRVGWVTADYFAVLGVTRSFGRALEPEDEAGIVLSHDLWVRRWGADPQVIGRTVDLSGSTFEVVGVLPEGRNANLTSFAGARTEYDVWRLMPPGWVRGDDRSVGWLRSTARLREGVTLAQAQAETDALMAAVNQTVTDRDGGTELRVNVLSAKADLVGGVSRTLWILLGAVLGVLLIAASNIAHLLLSRGEGRSAEVAVRAALGGSRIRLLRQFGVESGVLALVGGALGLGVAWLSVDVLVALAPPTLPRLDTVRIDRNVFAFSLLATAGAAFVAGVVPALRATRIDLAVALGEGRSTRSHRQQRFSRVLVVAEVALSLTLLTATGLLLRSMVELGSVDLGFERDGVLTFALEATDWGQSAEEGAAIVTAYENAMANVGGVHAVGFSNRIPLGGGLYTGTYRSAEMAAAEVEALEASLRLVTPGFFDAIGARLTSGRNFRASDGANGRGRGGSPDRPPVYRRKTVQYRSLVEGYRRYSVHIMKMEEGDGRIGAAVRGDKDFNVGWRATHSDRSRSGAGWRNAVLAALFTVLPGCAVAQDIVCHDQWAAWAPDGASIVFVSTVTGDHEIYTVSLETGALRQLTDVPGRDAHPSFSPDGRLIAFQSPRSGDGTYLFIMDRDGRDPRQVTDLPGFVGMPVWASDGERLAFQRRSTDADAKWTLHVVSLSDGRITRLTEGTANDQVVNWRPTGLAFSSTRTARA